MGGIIPGAGAAIHRIAQALEALQTRAINRFSNIQQNVANRAYNAPMLYRKETPPAEQLESLRKARDYYSALADEICNSPPAPSETKAEHGKREQDARRVAAAYENSFNNQNALLGVGRKQA